MFSKDGEMGCAACITVTHSKQHPAWMVSLNSDNKIRSLMWNNAIPKRRQDLDKAYSINGAVYIAELDWLANSKSFLSEEVIASIMPAERSLDIDTEFDFKIFSGLIS